MIVPQEPRIGRHVSLKSTDDDRVGQVHLGLVVLEVEDELLVLDTERERVHQFNRSAGLIWKWYDRGASLEEITERLVAEFEVSADTAQQDAQEMLTRFRELSLIRRNPG